MPDDTFSVFIDQEFIRIEMVPSQRSGSGKPCGHPTQRCGGLHFTVRNKKDLERVCAADDTKALLPHTWNVSSEPANREGFNPSDWEQSIYYARNSVRIS